MVFDEATSALDSLTEEEVTRTIRDVTLRSSAITILVAHRLSTVMHADRIYVLERGAVVEVGRTMNSLRAVDCTMRCGGSRLGKACGAGGFELASIYNTHGLVWRALEASFNSLLFQITQQLTLEPRFFAISGVILSLPFACGHSQKGKGGRLRSYFLRRLTR